MCLAKCMKVSRDSLQTDVSIMLSIPWEYLKSFERQRVNS